MNLPCPHYDYCGQRESADPRFVSALTKSTFAVLLAGGRGSLLHQLTDWRAKPAVPFGGKFRIIDFTLSNCVNSGVRRVAVATQYKAHSLIRQLQRGWSFLDGRFDEFIDIVPAAQQISEDAWYQGTADAVFQNLNIIRREAPEYVLILSGITCIRWIMAACSRSTSAARRISLLPASRCRLPKPRSSV